MSLFSMLLRSSISLRPLLFSSYCSFSTFLGAKLLGSSGGVNVTATAAAVHKITSQNTRSVWSEVVRQIPSDDPNKVGQLTFEDPDLADARMLRALRAEAPLRRRTKFVRHEKEWMRRKRLKMERRYFRMQEGVEELKAYIKFKQDNKPSY